MEKITSRSTFSKLLLFLILGLVIPYVIIVAFPAKSTYIFTGEVILLSALFIFRKNYADALKDLFYIEYSTSNFSLKISEKLWNFLDNDLNILASKLYLDGKETISLKHILKEEDLSLESYNGYIINVSGTYFKINFTRLGKDLVRCYFTEVTNEIEKIESFKNDKQVLLKKYDFYTSIIQNMNVPIVVRDRSMQIVFYNRSYYDLAIGKDSEYNPENLDIDLKFRKMAMDALSLSQTIQTKEFLLLEEGKYLYEIVNIPIEEEGLVVSSFYDVREVGKVKKDFNDLKQGIQSFIDTLSYACMVISKDGKLRYYNLKFQEIWGFESKFLAEQMTHTEILDHLYLKGKLPAQVNYTSFKNQRLELHSALKKSREDFFYLPDGKCVKSKAVPFDDNSVLFTYEDITDKLNVERSLNSADKIRDSIIHYSRDGVVIFGIDGKLESINPNMLKIWDITQEKSYDLTIEEFMEKSFAGVSESEKSKIENAFSNALVSNIEVEQMIKGPNETVIHRNISPLPYKGIMISDMDVTEEFAKIESYNAHILTLTAIDRDKSRFLANLPNKMRGAINSIIGISHILLIDNVTNLTKEQSQYLIDLKKSADYISQLIKDSENYSDFVDVYNIPNLKEINLMICFKNAIKFLKEDLESKNIKCKFKHELSSMPCFIDPIKLQNALIAILQNVIYRSNSGNFIEIIVKPKKDKYYISILDNGLQYQNLKNKSEGFNYYNLSITYARILLKSLDIELFSEKSQDKNVFKFELKNDRSLIEYN